MDSCIVRSLAMKSAGQVAVLTVLVVVVLASASRFPHQPSVEETTHFAFRHLARNQTIVNLPPGEDARDHYRLTKLTERLFNKRGVNDLY